jgi:glycosyltransferase involved in cell wall biosynthesis
MTSDFLSIVIPAYNEEANLRGVIAECLDTLRELTDRYEIIIVDDCSTDGSWPLLQELSRDIPELRPIRNPVNLGCHPASRVGYLAAEGDYRYFIPADRQIPAAEITRFLELAKAGCEVVYSWRQKRADPLHRLWISGFYNLLLRLFFRIRIHDVDSAELLTRHAVERLMPNISAESAFMTVELLLEAQRQNLAIGEVVISHRPRTAGIARGLNFKDIARVPADFLRVLWWFWHQKLMLR